MRLLGKLGERTCPDRTDCLSHRDLLTDRNEDFLAEIHIGRVDVVAVVDRYRVSHHRIVIDLADDSARRRENLASDARRDIGSGMRAVVAHRRRPDRNVDLKRLRDKAVNRHDEVVIGRRKRLFVVLVCRKRADLGRGLRFGSHRRRLCRRLGLAVGCFGSLRGVGILDVPRWGSGGRGRIARNGGIGSLVLPAPLRGDGVDRDEYHRREHRRQQKVDHGID